MMEYIYAAMLLHTTGQEINEGNVTKVLEAAGAEVDDARVKALIAALEEVDIEEAMEKTAVAAAPATGAAAPAAEEKVEEEEEEEEKEEEKEEEAAAGLGALFG
jgi:large subunit ribosomal protein L12